ncbi:MAG: NAD(P)/FAD-dependent oxidoreductase [Cyanobacteria bacterium P01_A01_bin.135]
MRDLNRDIVILGGGFVGLFTALHLQRLACDRPRILVDRNWRFVFKPLLYELLTSENKVDIIWPRFDELLAGRDISFVLDTINAVNLEQRRVITETGLAFHYRYLVLALGATTGYFRVPGAEEHSFDFRDGQDVIVLGQHLRKTLQVASQTTAEQRRKHLTVAIIGAGPSGVELAATLADLLPTWYGPLGGSATDIKIVVLQRGQEILKGVGNDTLKATANEALKQRSVQILLGAKVTAVRGGEVAYEQDGEPHILEASTVVWTAGTSTNPLLSGLAVASENRDRRGRLKVLPTLQLPEYPEVFAGGDGAFDPENPQPNTAQVAYQQGEAIADNIIALIEGKPPQAAGVSLRGTLLKLGVGESAAEIFDKFEVKGHAGHLIREATYLSMLPLPGYKIKSGVQWLTEEVFERVLRAQN